jgi:hypothetical protein
MNKRGLQKTKKSTQYYMRIIGWILVIILPLSLIVGTYISTYRESLKVSFESELTDSSVFINQFIEIDEIQTIDLEINWIEFKKPIMNTTGELVNGSYTFAISYQENSSGSISQVMVTPVLQTQWANVREVGSSQLISNEFSTFKIDFNYEMPQKPLYFIKVNEPILYLKVTLVQTIGGNQIPHIYYVMYDLTNEFPTN